MLSVLLQEVRRQPLFVRQAVAQQNDQQKKTSGTVASGAFLTSFLMVLYDH